MSKRLCINCGKIIPNRFYLEDGRQFSLMNRKRCLECSPHKIQGPRNSKTSVYYKNNKDKWKRRYVVTLYKRALSRKLQLLKSKGNKCQSCGYNKCIGALAFHHRNPNEKKFGLSVNNLWAKTWENIQKEAEKCDLLCMNCHSEHHYQEGEMIKQVKELYGEDLSKFLE